MVLDNATSADEPGFDSFSPDEDQNNTASSLFPHRITINSPPNTLNLNLESLPQWWPEAQKVRLADFIKKRCESASRLLERPLQRQEAEAFTVNAVHADSIYLTGGFAVITGVGIWAAVGFYRGVAEQRQKLASKANPQPSMWKSIRPVALSPLLVLVGITFVGSYATTVHSVRDFRDPRLAEWTKKVMHNATQSRAPRENVGTTQSETFEQRRQRQSMQDMIRKSPSNGQQPGAADNASPTNGAFMRDWSDFAPSRPEDLRAEQNAEAVKAASTATAPSDESQSDFYVFDGEEDDSKQRQSTSSSGGPISQAAGGAWDRIRQEAAHTRQDRRRPD